MTDAELEMINFARNLHSGGLATGDDYWTPLEDINSLGELVTNHLRLVALGLKDFEYKLLASFALMQSSLCSIAPIIQLLGAEGSGKSQLLLAVAELSGQDVFVGGSTGASIKNHINKIRWVDATVMSYERNCLLLCDNANKSTFESDEALAAFLNGYNRKTDKQFISNGKGENIEFRTFCPKLFTSVWNVESKELLRRTLIIKTAKFTDLKEAVEIESINWNPARTAIKEFWSQPQNWTLFAAQRQQITKANKPRHSKEHWILLRDLLATGVVCQVFNDTDTAIAEAANWLDVSTRPRMQILDSIIIEAIENYCGQKQVDWDALAGIITFDVPPKTVKQAVDTAVSDGLIERPKLANIQECLQKLKFKPARNDSSQIVYRRLP